MDARPRLDYETSAGASGLEPPLPSHHCSLPILCLTPAFVPHLPPPPRFSSATIGRRQRQQHAGQPTRNVAMPSSSLLPAPASAAGSDGVGDGVGVDVGVSVDFRIRDGSGNSVACGVGMAPPRKPPKGVCRGRAAPAGPVTRCSPTSGGVHRKGLPNVPAAVAVGRPHARVPRRSRSRCRGADTAGGGVAPLDGRHLPMLPSSVPNGQRNGDSGQHQQAGVRQQRRCVDGRHQGEQPCPSRAGRRRPFA